MDYLQKNTYAFRNAEIALAAGAFNAFTIIYCVQPLMPELSKTFNISPAITSLCLSLTTIAMAVSSIFIGILSDAWGRKSLMTIAMVGASVLTILAALSPTFNFLLVLRTLTGITLAVLPALAYSYLGEEVDPSILGYAIGLYLSGNTIGSIAGRVIGGTTTDLYGWRITFVIIGALSIVATLLFWRLLPSPRNFKRRPLAVGKLLRLMLSQLKVPSLFCLYCFAFLNIASFCAMYNYIGYLLTKPPYSLSETQLGWIFILYLTGTISSTYMGRLADKHEHKKLILITFGITLSGALITLHHNLWVIIIGMGVFTFGSYGTGSAASSWLTSLAKDKKAQASSLYFFFFYTGSSFGGTIGGVFWSDFGWTGVIGMISCYIFIGLVILLILSKIVPNQHENRHHLK